MSDVYILAEECLNKCKDIEKAFDEFASNFLESDIDDVKWFWENEIIHKKSKIKKCIQGGLGMAQTLPTNSVYRGKLLPL